MMNPYVLLAVFLFYVGSVGGAYFFGRSDGGELEKAKAAEIQEVVNAAKEGMISAAAKAISEIEVKHVTIRQQLEKEVVEKPVYRECRHTPDGLRYLNQALTNSDEPAPSDLVPTPSRVER